MGVHVGSSTMPGCVTPICNSCGIALCWDLTEIEYAERRAHWDAWLCETCNGSRPFHLPDDRAQDEAPRCPYCGHYAQLVTGAVIYPHRPDLVHLHFWDCRSCEAYVGCHPDGVTPLGTLANSELRTARWLAHHAFDPLWVGKRMTRNAAYVWLAEQLGLPLGETHIGHFDVATCDRVVALAKRRYYA